MKDFLLGVAFVCLFAIPFLPLYVEDSYFFPFITGKNFGFRILVEVMFASWVLLALYDKDYRPRFSWILAAFGGLLGVMLVANLHGEYPFKSFWSNFERMDGYVTLVHVFMMVTVAGSLLRSKQAWSALFHTSVAVALLVAVYGLMQHTGMVEGGRARIDSKLGNAAYMAVYMLFHIFMVFYLFVTSKVNFHRVVYALVALILIYTLLLTGTRGTFLGFIGGTTVAIGYVAAFGYKYPLFRKWAAAAFVGLILLAGGFYTVRDSAFVQDSTALRRIANIDIAADLGTRSVIWGMALEGVKERPLLGWGQGNFNYVFNKQYEPVLWNKEAWFDRVHDIFLDWLIAGGVFGLIAYLSIFAAVGYYLIIHPLRIKEEGEYDFSVLERAVLIGLLVGYFMHNLVVFDNIISYIFFGLMLAFIHYKVATPIKAVAALNIDQRLIVQIVAPVVVIAAGCIVWFVNVPGMQASSDIIDAIQAQTVADRQAEFESALARESFADQEIVEQMAQNAMAVANNQKLPIAEREAFIQSAEAALIQLVKEKPNDARLHTFFATFYRHIGAFDHAREQAAIARSLSPRKQAIIVEQGIVEIQAGDDETARDFFRQAFAEFEANTDTRILYAALLLKTGERETAENLIEEEYVAEFANNDYAFSIASQAASPTFLSAILDARIKAKPHNAQNYASKAYLLYQNDQIPEAIAVLQESIEMVPDFEPRAQCFIDNLSVGNPPEEGC